MFEITRRLGFCYGHRLLQHPGRCVHLHGHNGQLEITLAAAALDDQGMVVDFQQVRDRLGAWIDAHLDHRMVLQSGDPALPVLQQLGEPVVEVPFPPTAENLARYLYERARELQLPVVAVRLQETPSCDALYRPDSP
jgi:6-pyruvoyltetrahydropterin/6-carboxytetrahydropterin synthase